jgi:hypothetical protein
LVRGGAAVWTLLAGLVALVLWFSHAVPVGSAPLLYVSHQDDDFEFRLMDPRSGLFRKLMGEQAEQVTPVWSPMDAGSSLFWADDRAELYLMDARGETRIGW